MARKQQKNQGGLRASPRISEILGPNDPRWRRLAQLTSSSDNYSGELEVDRNGVLTVKVKTPLVADGDGVRLALGAPLNLSEGSLGVSIRTPLFVNSTGEIEIDVEGLLPLLAGRLSINFRTVTTTSTLLATDLIVLADGTITLTLPPANTFRGRIMDIKNIDAVTTVTIDQDGSETIDGSAATVSLLALESLTLFSDGTEWWIL